jgi:hypothetical protein
MKKERSAVKRDGKYYVKPKELYLEIMKSKEQGELTKGAVDMLYKIANKTIERLSYKYEDDKYDGVQLAMLKCLLYWKNFNPEISPNAFAFFTSVVRNAYAESFNKLNRVKQSEVISLSKDYDNLF